MNQKALGKFDLNLVKVFLEIWESRSLTATGEVLGLTQPAISHALRRLRDTFDDPLFVRVGNKMEPTEIAWTLREPLIEAVNLMGQAVEGARGFDPATTRRQFRLAMTDTGETVLMPSLLASMEREAPRASLVTEQIDPAGMEFSLRSGRVDLAVGFLPQLEQGACEGALILEDRLICLLRRGHPILTADWSVETFAALSFLDVSPSATGHSMGRDALAGYGITPRIAARLDHFTVLPDIVRRTDHVAIFPFSVFRRHAGRGDLVMRELPVPVPSYAVKVWRHRQFASERGLTWMRDLIVGAAGD